MLLFSAACVLFSHGETERERVVCVCACEARVFNENRNDDYCGEITTPREEILELVASSSLGHVCLFFLLSLEFRVFVFFFSLVCSYKRDRKRVCRPTKKRACASKKTSGAPLLFLSLSLSLFARACVCVYFYACVCVSSFYSILSVLACVCVCLCF